MEDRMEFARLVARAVVAEMAAVQPEYMNSAQAAAFLGMTEEGLATMRKEGRGPSFVRASGKLVRYRIQDLRDFMNRHLVKTRDSE